MKYSKINIEEIPAEIEFEADQNKPDSNFSLTKVFKNFSFLSIGQISGDVFTFILFVVISRIFGEQGIGQYSFAMGLTGFFAIVSDFGLYHFSVKELSASKENFKTTYGRILSARIILSILIFLLMIAALPLLNFSYETKLIILIIGLYQILYKIVDGASAVFVAKEKMQYSGIIESSMKISIALTGIITAYLTKNLVLVLTLMPIIAGVQIFVTLNLIVKKIGIFKLYFSLPGFINLLKRAKAFGFSEFLNQIYTRVDIVLIGFLLGESASGIYNVAFRIIFFLQFIPVFASIALFPAATKLFERSKSDIKKFYDDSLSMMILIGIPITAGIWLFSPGIINLLFGETFSGSIFILKILSTIFLLKCLSSVTAIFLFACNKQNEKLKDQLAATLLSLAGNFILIKSFGIAGAAVAVTASEILLVILFFIRLKKELGFPRIFSRLTAASLGSLAFAVPLYFLHLPLFIAVAASVLIYFSIVLFFRDIRSHELKIITGVFNK